MGHKGALYPWESADKGVETTPPYGYGPDGEMVPILSGLMEHHISADVAWGIVGVLEGDRRRRLHGRDGRGDHARDGALLGLALVDRRGGPLPHPHGRRTRRVPRGRGRQRLHQRAGALEHPQGRRVAGLARTAWDSAYADELRQRLELDSDEIEGWLRVADTLVDGFDPETQALRAVRRVLRDGRRAHREAAPAADGGRHDAGPRGHPQGQGGQAGRRGDALPRALGRVSATTWRSPTTTTTSPSPATAAR